jgi:hypothetical protein
MPSTDSLTLKSSPQQTQTSQRTIRVLQIVGGMNRGGIETWLMHVLRHIDRDRFQIDFVVHVDNPVLTMTKFITWEAASFAACTLLNLGNMLIALGRFCEAINLMLYIVMWVTLADIFYVLLTRKIFQSGLPTAIMTLAWRRNKQAGSVEFT